jgi:hypothetical protein
MAAAKGGRSWWRWYDGEVRPEARSVALAAEYAQAKVRIWPKEKPGVRHRGDLRTRLFSGDGELARLIAGRPHPPCDDLTITSHPSTRDMLPMRCISSKTRRVVVPAATKITSM